MSILKITFPFYTLNILTIFSGITILYASIIANCVLNLKKRFAYSTIANISYVILAISSFGNNYKITVIFFIIGHAFTKINFFLFLVFWI